MIVKTQQEAKKLVKKINRQISKDNKAFEKMTPREKRVQIAQDVLAQLRSKRLVAESGVWLQGKGGKTLFKKSDIKNNLELSKVLSKIKQCQGCALGGMFMCSVDRAENLRLNKLEEIREDDGGYYAHSVTENDAFSYLKKFFPENQLEMIESAFEQGYGAVPYQVRSASFVCNIDDEQTRMRLIMENIIVNKGSFKPEISPVLTGGRWTTPGYKD